MRKFVLTFAILFICGLYLKGYSQEELLQRIDINDNSSDPESHLVENAQYFSNSSVEVISFLQQEGEQTEEQTTEQEEAEMKSETESTPSQPLPLENQAAREQSTQLESIPTFITPQVPEGSSEHFTAENEVQKKIEVKEEDSVLSFNFLYLLIQKFKLSEIME